jgi:hypothetical protein
MENKITQIEELLGLKYKDWNRDTITKLVSTKEALELFSPEMAEYLLENREENLQVKPIFIPVIYGMRIRTGKAEIEKALVDLNEGSKDREVFKKKVLEMQSSTNPIYRLISYITTLAVLETNENDLSSKSSEVESSMKEIKDLMLSFNVDDGFQITIELMDLIFPLRELYFKKHGVELLKGDTDLEKILNKLDAKTKEIFEYAKQQGIDPESLFDGEEHNHEGHDHSQENHKD